MNLSTDHDVMMAVRGGDVAKLAVLFEQYQRSLYNFFFKQTMNKEISEDLVQEVFLRILKYCHTYRGDGKFTTWMFQIARNARIDYYRKHKNDENPIEESEHFLDSEPDPEDLVIQESESAILQKALKHLSEEKREVLILSRYHNIRYEEIAKIQGCRVGTVKARVFRALKDLTKLYHELAGEK